MKRGNCLKWVVWVLLLGWHHSLWANAPLRCGSAVTTVDSMDLYKRCVEWCNGYKTLPLQMRLTISSQSNLVTQPNDSTTLQGLFYLNDQGANITMGTQTQVLADSGMVVINRERKTMLYRLKPTNWREKMLQQLGWAQLDSNILQVAKLFSVVFKVLPDQKESLLLTSRQQLVGTTLPKQTIEFHHKPGEATLTEVTVCIRKLAIIEPEMYASLKEDPKFERKLLAKGNQYFAIKESVVRYVFDAINHQTDQPLPFTVNSILQVKPETGVVPLGEFADYSLIKQ